MPKTSCLFYIDLSITKTWKIDPDPDQSQNLVEWSLAIIPQNLNMFKYVDDIF